MAFATAFPRWPETLSVVRLDAVKVLDGLADGTFAGKSSEMIDWWSFGKA